jgi:TIR domain-containing protein
MSTVFISYRRDNTAGEARALSNDLVSRLGENSVFMDVDSIALGRDFRSVLQETTASCDLMLVLIGRNWADAKDEAGRTRLENPGDYVRLEIEAALKRNIPVTPVLVQGAQMPAPEQLPVEIRDLGYRNGFELSNNRWGSDVREMMRRLGLEKDRPPFPTPQPRSKRWRVWVPVFAVIIAAALGGGLLVNHYWPNLILHPSGQSTPRSLPAEYRIFLHSKRPAAEVNKVKDVLSAAGYSVSGVDTKVDEIGGNGIDYSTKDSHRNFQPEAEKIADVINRALGTNLKPRQQSTAEPGYFGIWF